MAAKVGRPTKYKREYCDRLTQWMAKGMSFESFAGDVDVDRDTIYQWAKVHIEFSDAKKRGSAKSQAFWEKIGVAGSSGKLPGFQTGAWVFNMKNRFSWKDRQEIVTRDETVIEPSELSDSELDDRLHYAMQILDKHESDAKTKRTSARSTKDSKRSSKKKSIKDKSVKSKK